MSEVAATGSTQGQSGGGTPAPPTGITTTTSTPATTTTQPVAAPSGTSSDWTASLSDDLKGFVQTKGFKDPSSVIDSYRNFERLMGAPKDRLVKLPEKADDKAGWDEVYSKLGRPGTANDYGFKAAEGSDGAFTEFAKNTFHELGLTKAQGDTLAAKYDEFNAKALANANEVRGTKNVQEEKALKREWGAAFEQNASIGKRAAAAFGLDAPTIDKLETAMGYAGVMKFMHSIGEKLGEASFVTGNTSNQFRVMTPEAARHEINVLRGDKDFVSKYTSGDKTALDKMITLQRFANPEQT